MLELDVTTLINTQCLQNLPGLIHNKQPSRDTQIKPIVVMQDLLERGWLISHGRAERSHARTRTAVFHLFRYVIKRQCSCNVTTSRRTTCCAQLTYHCSFSKTTTYVYTSYTIVYSRMMVWLYNLPAVLFCSVVPPSLVVEINVYRIRPSTGDENKIQHCSEKTTKQQFL